MAKASLRPSPASRGVKQGKRGASRAASVLKRPAARVLKRPAASDLRVKRKPSLAKKPAYNVVKKRPARKAAAGLVGEVRYDDPSLVQKAIDVLNGTKLGGGVITVIRDKTSVDGTKVVVKGIPPAVGYEELRDYFASLGTVAFADVLSGSNAVPPKAVPPKDVKKGKPCKYWNEGRCVFGAACKNVHEGEVEESWGYDPNCNFTPRPIVADSAGITFFVDKSATEVMHGPHWAKECQWDSGPMRVRIVGTLEDMGLSGDGKWDPNYGIDMVWERTGWRSMVLQVTPFERVNFCVVRVDQPDSHPGCLQGFARDQVHASRVFSWSAMHSVTAPAQGQICDVHLSSWHCAKNSEWRPPTYVHERSELVPRAGRLMPTLPEHAGRQGSYTFDALDGVTMNFCLYLPPDYQRHENVNGSGHSSADSAADEAAGWPLIIFLHSMHGRLNGDNNLFYESDTPLRLLLGFERCPKALRERFIVLTPECPPDYDRPQGAGIWLRHGWWETSTYAPEVENGIMSLIESVASSCHVDRSRIILVGSSMGAYASLELPARNPNFFSAAALIAPHYDLEPCGPMEPLVEKLTQPQTLPFWVFHAQNDNMCCHRDTEVLVEKLREHSKTEVRFTSYLDTWSNQGHCADPVAFFARTSPEEEAHGDELFEWLASKRLARQVSVSET